MGLPWLAHHWRWPVGEEWLYQSWAHYLPVLDVVERLAAEGRRDLLTLGVTPVLAAQLDDPHCLRGVHDWLGGWLLRAHEAARLPGLAAHEHRTATRALELFETRWRHGASPLSRRLSDGGAVELLGGPATHPFGLLLLPEIRASALETGLADTALRLGARPSGIWAPECAYTPGSWRPSTPRRASRASSSTGRAAARRDGAGPARRDVGVLARPRPRRHLPRVVAARGLPGRARLPRLPHLRPSLRLKPAWSSGGTSRPSTSGPTTRLRRRRRRRPRRRRLRDAGPHAAVRAAGAARAPGADRRRLRHRALRPLK